MTRRTLRSALLLCLMLSACRGSFEAGQNGGDSGAQGPEVDAGSDSGSANGGERDSGAPEDAGGQVEVDAGEPVEDGGVDVDVDASGFELLAKFSSNDRFDDYLTDKEGRPLYFYAGDAAGARKSTCLSTDCAAAWPPFDWGKQYADVITALKQSASPPAGVMDFDYFHRDDGLWQVTYKNRPLYYYNADQGQAVTGDGVDKVWFVARNYFVFVRMVPTIAPSGLSLQPQGTPYLTDGAGKSIYARIAGTTKPSDAAKCEGECLLMWPEWAPVGELSKLPIPSSLALSSFSTLFRDSGAPQVAYQGYPLHYNYADEEPGETRGQEVNAWRLIAPSGF